MSSYPAKNKNSNEGYTKGWNLKQCPTVSTISQNITNSGTIFIYISDIYLVVKKRGQDLNSVAFSNNILILTLCDGHGPDGFEIAHEVCSILPRVILDYLRKNKNIEDEGLKQCFGKTQILACFKESISEHEQVEVGDFCLDKKTGSMCQIRNIVGQVLEVTDEDGNILSLQRSAVSVEKYNGGGCTCVSVILNTLTGWLKIMVLGDSRVMVIPPKLSTLNQSFNTSADDYLDDSDSVVFERNCRPYPIDSTDFNGELVHYCVVSDIHQLSNRKESDRIATSFRGKHSVTIDETTSKSFLVNPTTNDQIQPTRGFGDLAMRASGYSHVPEIFKDMYIPKGTLLVLGSDGLFDEDLWSESELMKFIVNEMEDNGLTTLDSLSEGKRLKSQLANLNNNLHSETCDRAFDTYLEAQIDDISLLSCLYV